LQKVPSVDATLKSFLHQVEILYEEALYPQCIKLLTRAKKLAIKYEKHLQIQEILIWERWLIDMRNYSEVEEEDIDKLSDASKQTVEKIINIEQYWVLSAKVSLYYTKYGRARKEREIKKFQDFIIDHPLLKHEEQALSYEAKFYFYRILILYYNGIRDSENSYKYTRKHIELLESYPLKGTPTGSGQAGQEGQIGQMDSMQMVRYVSALGNVAIVGAELKKYDEVSAAFKKIKALPIRYAKAGTENVQIAILNSYTNELDRYLVLGEFKKGIEIVKEIATKLEKYEKKIPKGSRLIFYYNIAYLYIGDNNYTQALDWINKILNDRTLLDAYEDILCFSRILNLIIHFELDNLDLLEYAARSTYNLLDKRNRLYKIETAILHFFKNKLPKINITVKKELIAGFKELKTEIIEICKDPSEKIALKYFDFISWVESKIENRPFAEIVKWRNT